MPYVYRYKDLFDNRFKYIGIVKGDGFKNLTRRVKQHRKDDWFKNSEYMVDYIMTKTICDAEAIEGSLIGKYETHKYYNKAKKNWGESSLFSINNNDWKEYGIESLQQIYRSEINGLEKEIHKLVEKKNVLSEEELKKEFIRHCIIDSGMHTVYWDAIKSDLKEKINLYDDYAIDCSTKTSSDKWSYRANRIRSAIVIIENSMLERHYYGYSKEYREECDSNILKEKRKGA